MKKELERKIQILMDRMNNLSKDNVHIPKEAFHLYKGSPVDSVSFINWDWPQGVGLFGLWNAYVYSKNSAYKKQVEMWFQHYIDKGVPKHKHVNACAPLLTLAYLYEESPRPEYKAILSEWSEWAVNELIRTKGGGFQHVTSEDLNEDQLWDDTLFMIVLFLGKFGRLTSNTLYMEEALYQFLIHIHYLADRKTGLWYHGWTFDGNHQFGGALWGRGNAWVTVAIPLILDILDITPALRRHLLHIYKEQAESLKGLQDPSGRWHTLITDPSSYLETSCTAGFCFGILYGVRRGYLGKEFKPVGMKALEALLLQIKDNGDVEGVSYGTGLRDDMNFYKTIPICQNPYGQSLSVLALIESFYHI